MRTLSIDIETYSGADLAKTGMYTYAAHPDFRILLFAYSVDEGPVRVVDLAQGEPIPADVEAALTDPNVVKWAFNAAFERVCLSAHLGTPLDPAQWRCTMVWCSTLGLPMSLAHAGMVLGLEQQKAAIGKKLIKKFCVPTSPDLLNGNGNRNLPESYPDEWEQFKTYNRIDVEVELALRAKLERFPVPDTEWEAYAVDQAINDRGIRIDTHLATAAIEADSAFRDAALARASELTGLDNPNSPLQLQSWLEDQGLELGGLAKGDVDQALQTATGAAREVLEIRQTLAKSSVKKYSAMRDVAGPDGRARGLIQFYGAGRTGRFAGRLVQVQNLPRNCMSDLDQARGLLKTRDFETFELLYSPTPHALSELVRTAFIPEPGRVFLVADYSAIEARVLAWLAGEQWRLNLFAQGGDIYCQSAARMFKVPVEKNGVNAHLRQKGKVAELACGYGGSVGALKAMGALAMGVDEGELQPIVNAWRDANPAITAYWWAIDDAAKTAVRERATTRVGPISFSYESGFLFITLPSERRLAYVKPRLGTNRFGGENITYEGVNATKRWGRIDSYGPKLVENIVQAVSRDLLTDALARLEAAGYSTVMHVHDEIVVEHADPAALQDVITIMSAPPGWAAGLSTPAEGYMCDYYRKD